MSPKPIRVLVVDDSALMRKLIPQILETDNSIQVVGTAIDGNFGLKKIDELRPQVVTLDLEMPGMGGLEMLKEIMRRHRVPVIVVSSHSTQGASVTLKALSLGAFDFVAKPTDVSSRMQEIARDLISKIKAAAQSRGIQIHSAMEFPVPSPRAKSKPGTPKEPLEDCGHRDFHRRAAVVAVHAGAVPGRFSWKHCGGPAHAGGIYGNVRAPLGRMLLAERQRGAVGRSAAGRTSADMSGQPAYQGQAAAAGGHRDSERRSAGEWASPLCRCDVQERCRRVWATRGGSAHDRNGRRRRQWLRLDEGCRWDDDCARRAILCGIRNAESGH